MSLRQLTDAVTALEHNRAHDKHVVTRTYSHSSTHMLAQEPQLRWCAGQQVVTTFIQYLCSYLPMTSEGRVHSGADCHENIRMK